MKKFSIKDKTKNEDPYIKFLEKQIDDLKEEKKDQKKSYQDQIQDMKKQLEGVKNKIFSY